MKNINKNPTEQLTPEQNRMLALAASKLGITQNELASKLRNGDVYSLASGNSQIMKVISDRQAMERLMNSPQAKALIESLTKQQRE